jgi:hypothetical protein
MARLRDQEHDRRRKERYPVEKCQVIYRKHAFWVFFERKKRRCPVIDMSSTGIAFVTNEFVSTGSDLRLAFSLDVLRHVVPRGYATSAQVVYCVPFRQKRGLFRVGCKFVRQSAEDQRVLKSIIKDSIMSRMETERFT